MMPPKPRKLEDFRAGERLFAGMGDAEILPDIDLETYSEAGGMFSVELQQWVAPKGLSTKWLPGVGTPVYSEHPSCDVLSLAYDLKDGNGRRLWIPSAPMRPDDLLEHIRAGGLIEAWNAPFEFWLWKNVLVPKYGFPPLQISQVRDAAAKALAFGLPKALKNAAEVLQTDMQKGKDGKRLITKFSIPRNPTLKNSSLRIFPTPDDPDTELLYQYNLQDIATEADISSKVPDLSRFELELWKCDLAINQRGVAIDLPMIHKAIRIVDAAHVRYNKRLQELTDDECQSYTEIAKITRWLFYNNVQVTNLKAETIEELLSRNNLPPHAREVIKIRSDLSSASVKKLYAMKFQATRDGRLHDLFGFHGARTGRWTGAAVQPQNLPKGFLEVFLCNHCKNYSGNLPHSCCPWCGVDGFGTFEKWNAIATLHALTVINTGSLSLVEYYFGNAIDVISCCLRSLFIAAPGKDLICSDYSAIEAVVLAFLAGEQWRMDVFNTHGKIYEMSASKITGIPFETYIHHKKITGEHHPDRGNIGKICELGGGFGGGIGAYKSFGADKYFPNDEKIKEAVYAWRRASPAIVEFWGGQKRRMPGYGNFKREYFGLEGCAIQAVMFPGREFSYRSITYIVRGKVLYCRLPSGRYICYHNPELEPWDWYPGLHQLSYEGWNSNPKAGAPGWVRMRTYSGKLCENVVQAVARDLLAYAIVNLEKAGYTIVLHVHDEIVAEVDEGFGSVEEFERIMSQTPPWASEWPVKVSDGWRGKRYKKS